MADKNQWKPHAIMFPVPFQGHINPSINLILKLASKGFAVTFIHFEHVHHRLSKAHRRDGQREIDFFEEARGSGLDVRYLTVGDGFPLDFDRNLHFDEYWEAVVRDFPNRAEKFLEKILAVEEYNKEDRFLVPFIVADTSYSWPADVAKKYDLVNVSFWTEPALVLSLMCQTHGLIENGHFPCKGNVEEIMKHVPGIDTRGKSYLMQILSMLQSQPHLQKFLTTAVQGAKKADFILHNTVQELEPETLTSLNEAQSSHYAIGPTNFYENLPTIPKSLWSESDCTEWLESKPPGSVLYVSFGSLVMTSKQVLEEIAHGLLSSGVSFIWVDREGIVGSTESHIWPDGFEGGSSGRGLVVPWCDQVRVLSHGAVGGFLTHCGWNSVLEGLWFGVPMICYPITFDQPTNRKLVVEDWGNGINLGDGDDGGSVFRDGVSEKIRFFMMSGEASKGLRLRAEALKGVLRGAVVEGDGSSEKNFDRFVDDLKKKIGQTTLVGW